jgi:anhydro-N-acetylmuramic acid kinase
MQQAAHPTDRTHSTLGLPVWAIGLMTGTALDGFVDAALLRTDGERIEAFGRYALYPYTPADRALLAGAIEAARDWSFRGPQPGVLGRAQALVTHLYADAALRLVDEAGLRPGDVRVIGGHGLTVLHRPAQDGGTGGHSLQLLDGPKLARLTGIDCVFDFRAADIAAGGQGAPLAPVYHAALLAKARVRPPAAVLNLGGVANLTCWSGGDNLIATDTGPANGPLNSWIERHGLGTFDRDGAIAAAGRVHEGRLLEILDNPWFDAPWPKSLDRYDFDVGLVRGLSVEDGAATLTALSAAAIDLALRQVPDRPQMLLVAGGGRRNPTLMAAIEQRCGLRAIDADVVGLRGDAVEAECFAHLAVRSLRALPLSFPDTTGVPQPVCGGRLAEARA